MRGERRRYRCMLLGAQTTRELIRKFSGEKWVPYSVKNLSVPYFNYCPGICPKKAGLRMRVKVSDPRCHRVALRQENLALTTYLIQLCCFCRMHTMTWFSLWVTPWSGPKFLELNSFWFKCVEVKVTNFQLQEDILCCTVNADWNVLKILIAGHWILGQKQRWWNFRQF